MSTYGRLWEERKALRNRLRHYLPSLGPYATRTEAGAMALAMPDRQEVRFLLNEWDALEDRMAACDDDTGEPK